LKVLRNVLRRQNDDALCERRGINRDIRALNSGLLRSLKNVSLIRGRRDIEPVDRDLDGAAGIDEKRSDHAMRG
jgi:hypothetical protein